MTWTHDLFVRMVDQLVMDRKVYRARVVGFLEEAEAVVMPTLALFMIPITVPIAEPSFRVERIAIRCERFEE